MAGPDGTYLKAFEEEAAIKIRPARASGSKANKGYEGMKGEQLCFQMRRAKIEAVAVGRDASEGKIDSWSIEVAPGVDPALSLALLMLLEKHRLWADDENHPPTGSELMEEIENGHQDRALIENPLPGECAEPE